MSISNLFAPNSYDIFAKTITIDPVAGGILTDSVDAARIGDPLSIGTVRAGSLFVGRPGAITHVNGTSLNLLSSGGQIVIDDSASNLFPVYVGNANAASVVIGKPTGSVLIQAPLRLAIGTGLLTTFEEMVPLSATGGGCIPATPNFVEFKAMRVNNNVFLRWRFTGVTTVPTAATILTFAEQLPVGFRPVATIRAPAIASASLPTVSAYPAVLSIATNGGMNVSFLAAPHGGPNWAATADTCSMYEGSIEYEAP